MKIDLVARNNGAGLMVYRWEGSAQSLGYDDRKGCEADDYGRQRIQ